MQRKLKPEPQVWEWHESRTDRRQDEFRFGDRIYATLRWDSRFSRLACAQAAEGRWTFDRPRLLSRDVEIRANETVIAVYHEKWAGDGTLKFVNGHAIAWEPTDFWQTRWTFYDDEHGPLVTFVDTSGLLEQRERVTFGPSGLLKSDVALLVTLNV